MLRGIFGSGGGAPVGGTGTTNTIPRWTGPSTLGDSRATDDGTTFVVGSGAYAGTALPGGMQLKTTVPIYVATDGTRTTIVGTDGTTSCFVGSLTNHNFQIRASNATAITVLPAGNVGIGTTTPITRAHAVGTGTLLAGTAYQVLQASQDQTTYRGAILGYDSSGQIGIVAAATSAAGSNLAFWTYSGSAWGERARIDSAGRLLVGTTGTPSSAAVRVVVAAASGGQQWHSQGLGGCAVVASVNTAQWYVYPGANVGSEGYLTSVKLTETGLDVTTASATPGIKLPATPGNADTQTLDCYAEGTWTPTLTGFGGTTPTVSAARYTRVGRVVTLQVYLSATGGASFSSTAASTYISLPTGMTAAISSPGSTSNSGIAADGPCVAYTNGNLYLPTFALRSTDTFLNVTYSV